MSTIFDQGANAAFNGLRAETNPFFGEASADEAEWDAGFMFGLEILDGVDYETPPREHVDEEAPF